MTTNDLLSGVLRLRSAGLATIPIKTDGSKAPSLSSWKQFEKRLPTEAELQKWFGNGKRSGLALIGGKVSGNLEILDFDAPELIAEWRELVEEAAPGLLEQLPQVETPSGGGHVLYRCAEIAGNTKLAQREVEVPEGTRGARPREGRWFKVETTIETRGEGGYVITAGSPAACHPSNKPYKLINGDLKAIPEIAQRERALLLACARSFNRFVKASKPAHSDQSPSSGVRPGDDFNQRGAVRPLLEEYGWKYLRQGPCGELWQRPGGEHTSATLFEDESLYVFSSNAYPFEHERRYDRFSIYTILQHGGDWRAAAKALAAEGYGKEEQADPASDPTSHGPAPVVAHYHVLDSILAKVTKLNFPALFQGIDSVKQKHFLVASIEELLKLVKAQNYQLARKNDFVFAFNGEYWKEIDREALKDFLMAVAQKQGIQPFEAKHYEFRDKLYKQFLALAGFRAPEPSGDKVLINLLNGTFEIGVESQAIRDFCANDFLTHQLQFRYDKDATAPKFQAYLDRVLPEKELQEIIAEYFGYVFTKNLKLEKALLLYGSGANGKSVLFDVQNALLGRETTANYSLSDLMEEHNRAQIAHKLLNYGSEINASITKDIFKALVSGEPIMARLKYGNSFLMERYAKLCFNCNELPKDVEQSEAYFRRFLIIPFRVTLPESEWDVELAQKIIKEELAGVFNWVLDGLKRLLKQKKFTESRIVREMIATYKLESDSVACFLRDENWEADPLHPEHTTTLKKLHLSYQSYCREAGHKPLGRNNFKKRLAANKIVEATKAGRNQEFYINHMGAQA